jgi:23S rRNA (guanine745-N1)-methyltransferase
MSKNEPFAPWQCPLCGEKLTGDSTLKCTKGHCFDRAKEGYWHLLPVQSMRTKAPGDSKEMVAARRAFLNAGYYGIFGKAVGELCAEYGQPASPEAALHLLDAGCGEGWYDRCIAQALAEKGRRVQLAGFDIAKPAVRLAAKALPTGDGPLRLALTTVVELADGAPGTLSYWALAHPAGKPDFHHRDGFVLALPDL